MSEMAIRITGEENCWTQIGVWGNRTCPELTKVHDCRNCGIYTSRGRKLLDRPAPDGHIESWATIIAEEKVAGQSATSSYLVFRLGQAWFAFLATSLQEVASPSVIRSVPHRSRDILLGLVNVRGELHPCISLHTLFGEESGTQRSPMGRLLVARWAGEYWVFPADKVAGIHEVGASEIEPPPVTVSNLALVYTQGLFRYEDKTVAVIDEGMLFGELARRIA